jgi:hypothetical protein
VRDSYRAGAMSKAALVVRLTRTDLDLEMSPSDPRRSIASPIGKAAVEDAKTILINPMRDHLAQWQP